VRIVPGGLSLSGSLCDNATMLFALIIAASALDLPERSWTFRSQTNLLGQPEAVAELPELEGTPGQYLRFSCSVMTGPVLEVGLGLRSFENFSRFSATEAAQNETVALSIRPSSGAPLQIMAAPVAEQATAFAFTTGGSDAVAAARAIAEVDALTVSAPNASAEFQAPGAPGAIAQVLAACPFAG
jgi:hypothetical protein